MKKKVITFRVSEDFYSKFLESHPKISRYIRSAIEEYEKHTLYEGLLKAYQEFDKLFQKISEYFKKGRQSLSLDLFIEMTENMPFELIDKINEEIRNE